ncbi:MAG TPA: hypothetical protein VF807_04825, partial [Ktedonobacterales bacterium]
MPKRLWRRLKDRTTDLASWYWGFSGWVMRVAHPLIIGGASIFLFVWLQTSPNRALAWTILIGGVLLAAASTLWLTYVYYRQFPGRSDVAYQEYIARRVSRLAKADFIPGKDPYGTTGAIRQITRTVRDALHLEVKRIHQLRGNHPSTVFGVLVTGPGRSGKQSALWDAMAHELKGWT